MQLAQRKAIQPHRWRLFAWVAGITAFCLLVGAGGAAAALRFDEKHSNVLFEGVKVEDVPIDGMQFAAAKQRLLKEFDEPLDRPLPVRVEGRVFQTTPRKLGVSSDVLDVYRKAVSIQSEMPLLQRVWHRLSGKPVDKEFNVTFNYDEKKVDAFIDQIAKAVDKPAKDATLSVTDAGLKISEPVPGYALDKKTARETLSTVVVSPGISAELQGKVVKPAVTKESFKDILVVKVGENKLYHYKGEELLKVYGVATGLEEFPTPIGKFKIVNKRFMPTWVNPAKAPGKWGFNLPAKIPAGPGNPLGTRAMDLNSPGIRIHGTYADKSIGYNASHGCVRMRIADVEELFDRVGVGTQVIIMRAGPLRPIPAQVQGAQTEPLAEADGTAVPGVGTAPPPPPPAAPAPAAAPSPTPPAVPGVPAPPAGQGPIVPGA